MNRSETPVHKFHLVHTGKIRFNGDGFASIRCCLHWLLILILMIALAAGCDGNDGSNSDATRSPKQRIPDGTKPCEHPEYWLFSLVSEKYPFMVHYCDPNEEGMAREVIAHLEAAWEVEVNEWQYVPPPSDEGLCGPDGAFDVFIWEGHRACWVNIVSEDIVTPWGGRASFMLLDPWGPYGGEILGQTVAHEFNHATQAANDWHETAISFEMTSVYIEQFFGPACSDCIVDFQSRPDWSLLWDDNYNTWYMYGSALYFHFIRDRYFESREDFLPHLWLEVRNYPDLWVNSPNLVDGLNTILAPLGESFMDSVIEFARWRYYTGPRDDGKHFRRLPTEWSQLPFLPESGVSMTSLQAIPGLYKIEPAPMVLGSVYLEIGQTDASQTSFELSLVEPLDQTVDWIVQAVPGISEDTDGNFVDLKGGSARVPFGPDGTRTLIITSLPRVPFDPDAQTGNRCTLTVRLAH